MSNLRIDVQEVGGLVEDHRGPWEDQAAAVIDWFSGGCLVSGRSGGTFPRPDQDGTSGKKPQSRMNVYKQMYPPWRFVDLVDQESLDNDDIDNANGHEHDGERFAYNPGAVPWMHWPLSHGKSNKHPPGLSASAYRCLRIRICPKKPTFSMRMRMCRRTQDAFLFGLEIVFFLRTSPVSTGLSLRWTAPVE